MADKTECVGKIEEKVAESKTCSRPFLKETILLEEAGMKLRLKEEALAASLRFYHVFQLVMEREQYDNQLVTMASLSLAAKVHEAPVKLSDVINTCYRCWHKDRAVLEVGPLYWQLKDSVAKYELLLLRALKFQLHQESPHCYMIHHLLSLSRWVDENEWKQSQLPPLAWALLQDSYHTLLPSHHPPNLLACAILYLSVHCCRLQVSSGGSQRQWWQVCCPNTQEAQLQAIAEELMQVYDILETSAPFLVSSDTNPTTSASTDR